MKYVYILLFSVATLSLQQAPAQQLDLLIKNGHVIDLKNDISEVLDVGVVGGRIVEVGSDISSERADLVVDAAGLYVTPGLIDIHVHVFHGTEEDAYLSNSYTSLPPDGFTFRSGVTTVVDVGGAGWRNFRQFKVQTIDRAKTRVLSFLNIVGAGMKGGAFEQDLADMDAKLTAQTIRQYREYVVGVKVAHYAGRDWTPVDRAVEAGRQAEVPVMVDFGRASPPLSIEALFFEHLRPGDIYTHAYAHVSAREPIVDEQGTLRPFVLPAQERGIVFDVGHGGGSFLFQQAVPATRQGLWPNTISTDLHTGSMNGGMKSLINVMSKFLNLGMPLEEVVSTTTWQAAQTIQRTDLGHLDVGGVADIAVFRLLEGDYGFIDTGGNRMKGTLKLETELTIRDGAIVWDLNGISSPDWDQ